MYKPLSYTRYKERKERNLRDFAEKRRTLGDGEATRGAHETGDGTAEEGFRVPEVAESVRSGGCSGLDCPAKGV